MLFTFTHTCQSDLTRQGLSRVSIAEDQPTTLGHSQSVMNIPRTSPTAQLKKRRAPSLPGAPPVTVVHANFESYQVRMQMKTCIHTYAHRKSFPLLLSYVQVKIKPVPMAQLLQCIKHLCLSALCLWLESHMQHSVLRNLFFCVFWAKLQLLKVSATCIIYFRTTPCGLIITSS